MKELDRYEQISPEGKGQVGGPVTTAFLRTVVGRTVRKLHQKMKEGGDDVTSHGRPRLRNYSRASRSPLGGC